MSWLRRMLNARDTAGVAFAVLFLVIPVAVLAGVSLLELAAVALSLAAVSLAASRWAPRRAHAAARHLTKALFIAGALLAIVHATAILEPLYRREGWLELDLDVAIEPRVVRPGDPLTYTLSTTNTGIRPALGRRFLVDGEPYTGVVLYGRLPDLGGDRFPIDGTPMVDLSSPSEASAPGEDVCTVIYANPGLPELNPTSWAWTRTYVPGTEVVAVVTGDGDGRRDLGVGETLTLRYTVTVPPDHPAGEVHHVRASLSYRDPQWATYATHDIWFPFRQEVLVVAASDAGP